MKRGFKDIEEYFLQAEEKRLRAVTQAKKPVPRRERQNLINQIKNLNEKLKGKDRKIKELFKEIGQLRSLLESYRKREEELKAKEEEFKQIDEYKGKIEQLQQEVARLKGEVSEKEREIEKLKAQEVPKPKVELFIEVALNSVSELVAGKNRMKVLFSKRFRKDMVKEVSPRPFLFNSFISALERIESTAKLLKRDSKHDIYRVRVTSPYGEYRAIYLKMDNSTVKFVRFGQRDSIYQELEASKWNLD
ncbi:MAG: hypothetical protein ABGX12_04175 [Desulfurobacteriaceae bacterium]